MSAPHIIRHCRFLFIGSGPAALAAVISLRPNDRAASVILEAAPEREKVCPGIKKKSCLSCDGELCPVINNVGGSSATLGNKICHFPASESVRKMPGTQHEEEFKRQLRRFLRRSRADMSRSAWPSKQLSVNALQKFYNADRLMRDEYRTILINMISLAKRHVRVLANHPVQSIRKRADGRFIVSGDFQETFIAENVVVATGRSGFAESARMFEEVGIRYSIPNIDVGYRLEVDSDILNEQFFYQVDPKYKFFYPGLGSGRTFCTCRDGSIIPVKMGNAYFADGAFLKAPTGKTNFAIMARCNRKIDVSIIQDWCRAQNVRNGKTLAAGEIELRGAEGLLSDRICDLLPDGPIPEHTELIKRLTSDALSLAGSPVSSHGFSEGRAARIRVYSPAIDRYWPCPELRGNFEASVKGIWIIGDAAGLSRGIGQAIYSGVSWARQQRESDVEAWQPQSGESALAAGSAT
ncbi:MAG TPA: hypothetical protein VFQ67_01335 [Allosphingosinicella sp.]|jgi:hypothetical protein|nr:hypothetical protein [Allosphingosinicella sp.]